MYYDYFVNTSCEKVTNLKKVETDILLQSDDSGKGCNSFLWLYETEMFSVYINHDLATSIAMMIVLFVEQAYFVKT